MGFFDTMIEKKLMDMHCCYIGKVLSANGKTATVQPLGLIKGSADSTAKAQAVVKNIPIACQKMGLAIMKVVTEVSGNAEDIKVTKKDLVYAVPIDIEKDDLVVCVCSDRDISDARKGKNALPPYGRHNISDSIIVGVLQGGD